MPKGRKTKKRKKEHFNAIKHTVYKTYCGRIKLLPPRKVVITGTPLIIVTLDYNKRLADYRKRWGHLKARVQAITELSESTCLKLNLILVHPRHCVIFKFLYSAHW